MRKLLKNSVQVFLLIAIVFFTMMLIMMTGCVMDSNRKPEAPKNHAPTLDSVIAEVWVPEVIDSNYLNTHTGILNMDSIQEEHISEKIEEYDIYLQEDTSRFMDLLHELDYDADEDTDSTWIEFWDILDNLEPDSTWHGKEGKSEYGQYEPSDVERMWIGNDGDTIWE